MGSCEYKIKIIKKGYSGASLDILELYYGSWHLRGGRAIYMICVGVLEQRLSPVVQGTLARSLYVVFLPSDFAVTN